MLGIESGLSQRERNKLRENLVLSLIPIRGDDCANGIIQDALDLEMWILNGVIKKSPAVKGD